MPSSLVRTKAVVLHVDPTVDTIPNRYRSGLIRLRDKSHCVHLFGWQRCGRILIAKVGPALSGGNWAGNDPTTKVSYQIPGCCKVIYLISKHPERSHRDSVPREASASGTPPH